MNDSYAFTAAATRGSAGAELLVVADGKAELGAAVVVLPDVLAELPLLSDALGPGFGVLLLHPATAATIVAATNTIHRDLRTWPPFGGDVSPCAGVTRLVLV